MKSASERVYLAGGGEEGRRGGCGNGERHGWSWDRRKWGSESVYLQDRKSHKLARRIVHKFTDVTTLPSDESMAHFSSAPQV